MKTIWKFEIPFGDVVTIQMPEGAKVLSVGNQRERLCLWALVDPEAPQAERLFRLAGTGHPIKDAEGMVFIGTFRILGGNLVFHVFECPPRTTEAAPTEQAQRARVGAG